MKTTWSLVFIVLFMFAFIQLNSQITIGPKVGINNANMCTMSDVEHQTITGYSLGMLVEIPIVKAFAIQTGVEYMTKGVKVNVSGNEFILRPAYIQIPVLAVPKITFSKLTKVMILFGPYFGKAVAGTITENGISRKLKYSGSDKDMHPTEIGVLLGAGVEYGRLQLAVHYYLSLRGTDPACDGEGHNNGFSLTAAFLFGRRK